MRVIKLSGIFILLFALDTFADESESLVLKLRANYSATSPKQTGLPAPYTSFKNGQNAKLISSGIGGEASLTMFVTDHFAGEFGTGISMYRTKRTGLYDIEINYNNNPVQTKKKNLYTIPSYLTMQYSIAPYGAIRPYIGAGYHYTYVVSKSQQYKVKNASGLVFQGGVDFVLKDDTSINLDIKQYMFSTKIRYNTSFVTQQDGVSQISSKVKINPTVIAIGVGFKL